MALADSSEAGVETVPCPREALSRRVPSSRSRRGLAAGATRKVDAKPSDWPWMPLEPRRLVDAPRIGSWMWLITERVRHSPFHRVRSVETVLTDDGPVVLVEVGCGRVWPLDSFAAVVEPHDPVLALEADGTHAACQNCDREIRGSRSTVWSRLLAAHRSGHEP